MLCNKKFIVISLCLVLFFTLCTGLQAGEKQRKPVAITGKHFLPLRVLTRPFSGIYQEANEKSTVIQDNVPAFSSYIVYTRPEGSSSSTDVTGWYEVGSDINGNVLGWMKASDVMEWKQAMCLSFSHPLGRKPVLMFKDVIPLLKLISLPSDERKTKAEEYYRQIYNKQISSDSPLLAMEPEGAIDITKQFYLLPILEYTPVEIEGREARLIKLTSAVREDGQKAVPPVTAKSIKTPGAMKTVSASGVRPPLTLMAETLNMDIVFVVDLTSGMQPYINAAANVLRDISQKLSKDSATADRIRFGLWGYRDSTEIPGMEFVTKNFTEKLLDINSFSKTMSGIRETPASSADYDEDVFSGIDNAIRDTSWRKNALHLMILIGDAPGHAPGHKWNLSGQSAQTLRIFANDNKISIAGIHILRNGVAKFNRQAEKQFRTLSRNPGTTEATYFAVPALNVSEFSSVTHELLGELITLLQEKTHSLQKHKPVPGAGQDRKEKTIQAVGAGKSRNMGYACLVQWLGWLHKIEAPHNITAWVTDKDLINPSVSSLDVRILLNKNNLSSLQKTLGEILAAARRGQISGENFFSALVAVATVGARDPEQIRNAKNLEATGLLPEFMVGLPYKSQIMEMSNELWSAMSIDQQEEFINGLETKMRLYEIIYDSPGLWVSLTPGADEGDKVYPLPLESLP